MTGARIFVAVVFLLLGASFIASTALLIHEFQAHGLARPARGPQPSVLLLPGARNAGAGRLLSALGRLHAPLLAPPALREAALLLRPDRRRGGCPSALPSFSTASRASIWEVSPLRSPADRGDPAGRGACPILAARWRTCARSRTEPRRPVQVRAQLRRRPAARAARRDGEGALLLPRQGAAQRRGLLRGAGASPMRSSACRPNPATRSLSAQLDA